MSRKDKREETKKLETKPKNKIKIKKIEFKRPTKKQIVYIVFVLIGIVTVFGIANYSDIGLVINKSITDEDVVDVDLIGSNNKIYSYYNEVLIADSSGISTYNKYGKNTWSRDMQGAVDAKISTSGKFLQVINADKSIVYIYDDKYETAQIRVDGKILSGTINSRGDSVIEYSTSGNKTVLSIYDRKGNHKYNVKLSNSTIGQFVLSEDSSKLIYVDVNIDGISARSSVQFVELKGKNKESSVEEIAVEENALIYQIDFVNNSVVYRTDKDVVLINLKTKNKKTSSIEQEGIVCLDIDGKKYSYVEFKNGKYFLGIKTIGGKERKELEIKGLPKHYNYLNGKVYISYQKGMEIYNKYKSQIKEYNSDMVITKPVIIGAGNDIAFLVSNKLIIYTI